MEYLHLKNAVIKVSSIDDIRIDAHCWGGTIRDGLRVDEYHYNIEINVLDRTYLYKQLNNHEEAKKEYKKLLVDIGWSKNDK
jgi:hypothetical protein